MSWRAERVPSLTLCLLNGQHAVTSDFRVGGLATNTSSETSNAGSGTVFINDWSKDEAGLGGPDPA